VLEPETARGIGSRRAALEAVELRGQGTRRALEIDRQALERLAAEPMATRGVTTSAFHGIARCGTARKQLLRLARAAPPSRHINWPATAS